VIEFYLGQRSLIEMHAAGRNSDDKCEAAFYTREWAILRSDKAQAKASLQLAADTCPKIFAEYLGAVSELKRLGQ
jgi:hypothetical protein